MLEFEKTTTRKKLLLVGDRYFLTGDFAAFFESNDYDILSVTCESAELPAIVRLQPDIIIVDFDMHCNDPLLISSILHRELPDCVIAIMNGHAHHCEINAANHAGAQSILDRNFKIAECEQLLHHSEEKKFQHA